MSKQIKQILKEGGETAARDRIRRMFMINSDLDLLVQEHANELGWSKSDLVNAALIRYLERIA